MALENTLIGTSFTAEEISEGTVSGASPLAFTETKLLADQKVFGTAIGPGATATITSVATDPITGVQTITAVIAGSSVAFANGQTITGTVLGNDTSDFLLSGSIAGLLSGDLLVTDTPAEQPGVGNTATVLVGAAAPEFVACYCAGTLIRTEHGETPVERLAVGDVLITASGARRPVRWIGTRAYHDRFLASNDQVQPIRFRAGSLGRNIPSRDLLVSPKHAMFIDRVLVPAELLVNGSTVLKERGLAQVAYFHVELDSHDVIWAEGAPSESYVDDDNRGAFDNAATHGGSDTAGAEAHYCAPRVTSGFALEAVRARLNARAAGVARAA